MSDDIRTQIHKDIDHELDSHATQVWDQAFDAANTLNDWVTYIMIYSGRAAALYAAGAQRAALVKVAGLAVSALTAFDKNNGFAPRHYDTPDSDTVWENDGIQFPRLLAEIMAAGVGEAVWDELLASMDLESDQLSELFDRAQVAFERSKAILCPPPE